MPSNASLPAVVFASEGRFAPAGHIAFPCVQSRLVLMCRNGLGAIVVNDEPFEFTEGRLFILPWGCTLSYTADEIDPLAFAGVHVIPQHDTTHPVETTVAHDPEHELAGCPWRRDDPSLDRTDVVTGVASDYPDLVDVTQYAIRVFEQGPPSETVLRALGTLVVHELNNLSGPRRPRRESDLPTDLRRLVSYVDHHLDDELTTRTLADAAGYSDATLTRRFRTYLHEAPMAWVINRRLRRATDLLRTTDLHVSQIGRQCGIPDPYYFSRLFRQHFGEAPTTWRRTHRFL